MAAASETTGEVKLLGLWRSPFVTRVGIALNLKKVGYEFVHVEVRGQKSEILVKSNPVYKKIPVLIHQGKPICESAIIVEYIDEIWTSEPPIIPSHPFDRAVARFWAAYIDDKFLALVRALAFGATEGTSKAEAADGGAEAFQLLEEAFAKCSHGKEYFGGDTIGYLDIALGCWLGWIKAVEEVSNIKFLDEKKVPLLVGWAERFLQNKAAKGTMPEFLALVRALAFGATEGTSKAEAADGGAEAFQLLEEAFAKCSHGKEYFGGDTIGYLDIALGCWLGWIKAVEEVSNIKFLDEKKVPLLVGWAERFLQNKAAKGTMPEVDEYVEVHGQKSEILVKSNPVYKKIPVLIHQGKPICESAIIVEYIDEMWTSEPPILPSHHFDRAVARFWATYIDDKLLALLKALAFGAAEGSSKAETADRVAEVLQLLEEAFAACSHGKDYFGGDTIGYVDIALGSYLGWMKTVEEIKNVRLLDEKKVPLLVGWAERFLQDKAVKEVTLEIDEFELRYVVGVRII
ncbi:hypothetical protein C4D60_Mb05t07560 [Musa balbisiana]|uniref:glutathione transferase n=1 Tax=Musa balbisiana TaxID=52838 RepID=A0A4S8JUE0_MUSBA|nr:hypothetical protein C4D60_Mb05t07560 [Musa balbisiana]